MSYQEKRSVFNFVGTLLISGIYAWYMAGQRPQVDPYAPELFVFWGKFFVLLLIITTLIHIIVGISHGVFKGLSTSVGKISTDPDITDERDEIVDLKASRLSLYLFAAGVMLAMLLLWMGRPPETMFIVVFLSGVLSSLVGNVAELLYYRGGVSLG